MPRLRRMNQRERGVALLVVLATVALVTTAVFDFQFNARVDLQLAVNARDEVQAEYNALSALRMRSLLLKNARLVSQATSQLGIDQSLLPPVGQMLEMVPVECGLLSTVVRTAGGGDTEKEEGEEDFFPGSCSATSKSEHSKISLVSLRNVVSSQLQNQSVGRTAAVTLLGFLRDPKMQRHFEKDDAAGSHAESPEELLGAIVDWIDTDRNQAINSVGDEDRFYAYLKDSYRAKNAPMDSVAELQLVHGVSDELYNVLKDRITVYNNAAQIELSTADDWTIFLGLCSLAVESGLGCQTLVDGPFWGELKKLRELSGGITPMNLATLTTLVGAIGLPLDTTKLGTIFSDKSSTTWYTIEATGRVGNAQRRLRAVFQSQEAQYYYFRIE